MKKCRGFSLIEVVAVLAIVIVLSIPLATLSTTTILDIPQFYRAVQTNTTMLNMLGRLHKDINAAVQLPESFAEYTAGDKVLLIKLTDGLVCYQLENKKVIRRNLTSNEEDTTIWPVPNAIIDWRVWRNNGNGYAVEIQTCIERQRSGALEKKMENSHLYFVGAYQETEK